MHIGGGSSSNKLLLKREFYISFFKFYRKHYGLFKTGLLRLLCLNQFVIKSISGNEKALWRFLLRWLLTGASEKDGLRFQSGNIDGPLTKSSSNKLMGALIILGLLFSFDLSLQASLEKNDPLLPAIQTFQQGQIQEALSLFLTILKTDPKNKAAHDYVNLIAQQLLIDQKTKAQKDRLELMVKASQELEDQRRDPRKIDDAILETTLTEKRASEQQIQTYLDQAEIEINLGHFPHAYDLVLRTLSNENSNAEAQRLLSSLQSHAREEIDQNQSLSTTVRYVLEGFYQYAQANYEAAAPEWKKAHEVGGSSIGSFYFEPYEKIALAHVAENQERLGQQKLFQEGLTYYSQGRFSRALEVFRQLAIENPDYPELASYLPRAEADAEEERTRFMNEKRKAQIATLYNQSISAMEHSQYAEANTLLLELLKLDPTHPQARSYLLVVQAELQRRHDPKIAEQHYKNGIIAYAGGKLEEAEREWRITLRMDPTHFKAQKALSKVEKEIALYREAP